MQTQGFIIEPDLRKTPKMDEVVVHFIIEKNLMDIRPTKDELKRYDKYKKIVL